ncbi:MAG: hypothetical protein MJZ23_09400 [Paludibacteraceae bacterium]|nr:hypothetical protein [Paludibacteraceae bacterium]
MKIKSFIIILLSVLCLASCNNKKDTYMKDWDKLIQRIETKEKLNDEQLKTISSEYDRLNEAFSEVRDDMTSEERQKVGEYQARYVKAYASQTTNDLLKGLQGILDVAEGFINEFSKSDPKELINEVVKNIDTAKINNLARSIDEKKIENIVNSIDKEQINEVISSMATVGAALSGESINKENAKELLKNIKPEDIKKLKESITPEDIEAIKKSFNAEDIKELKKSLSPEEIKKLKDAYNEIKN